MGNRAVIAIKSEHISTELTPSIYLHWNGGRESVETFLEAANYIGIRWSDPNYACARLSQIIMNTMKGTISVGVGAYGTLDTDNYDNGVYWVSRGKIVGRSFMRDDEKRDCVNKSLLDNILEANRDAFPNEVKEYFNNQ